MIIYWIMIKDRKRAIYIFFLIIGFLGGFILVAIQSVEIYTCTSRNGKEVVFGFDRGFGGMFGKYDLTIANNEIALTRNKEAIVCGNIVEAVSLKQSEKVNAEKIKTVLANQAKHKVSYSIYQDDEGRYYCIGYFDKTDSIGYILWSIYPMDEDEALDIFSRFVGTKGIGYWINQVYEFIYDIVV